MLRSELRSTKAGVLTVNHDGYGTSPSRLQGYDPRLTACRRVLRGSVVGEYAMMLLFDSLDMDPELAESSNRMEIVPRRPHAHYSLRPLIDQPSIDIGSQNADAGH